MRWSQEVYLTSPKLISRLKLCFKKFRIRGDFEDFYHDYVVHILMSKGQHQTLDQFSIDQIRKCIGREGKKKELFNALNAEDFIYTLEENPLNISPAYTIFVKDILKKYKGRIRAILMLHYVIGYDQSEISFLFGISAGRVSQIIKAAKGESVAGEKTPELELLSAQIQNEILQRKLVKVFRKHIQEKIL